jgi:hypothetical protein
MNIQEFFDLPDDQRQMIIDLHNKQKKIRHTREQIADERQKLNNREFNNRMQCDHPFATKTYKAYENEFGNFTGGGTYTYRCEDCGNVWTDEQ